LHTIVLDDPTPDPPGLSTLVPEVSPEPNYAENGRLEDDWNPDKETLKNDISRKEAEEEAKNRAVVLEMIGDLPEADAAPPSNVLFICKLNPVTSEDDLEIIFSRFGNVLSCDIIRDWKTGESLCYGFISFESESACEQAYFKMNNVLVDDRRIKVDFSQSVHHLWNQFKKYGKRISSSLQNWENDPGKARRGSSSRTIESRHKEDRMRTGIDSNKRMKRDSGLSQEHRWRKQGRK